MCLWKTPYVAPTRRPPESDAMVMANDTMATGISTAQRCSLRGQLPCDVLDCLNNGTCCASRDEGLKPSCWCLPRFAGEHCETSEPDHTGDILESKDSTLGTAGFNHSVIAIFIVGVLLICAIIIAVIVVTIRRRSQRRTDTNPPAEMQNLTSKQREEFTDDSLQESLNRHEQTSPNGNNNKMNGDIEQG